MAARTPLAQLSIARARSTRLPSMASCGAMRRGFGPGRPRLRPEAGTTPTPSRCIPRATASPWASTTPRRSRSMTPPRWSGASLPIRRARSMAIFGQSPGPLTGRGSTPVAGLRAGWPSTSPRQASSGTGRSSSGTSPARGVCASCLDRKLPSCTCCPAATALSWARSVQPSGSWLPMAAAWPGKKACRPTFAAGVGTGSTASLWPPTAAVCASGSRSGAQIRFCSTSQPSSSPMRRSDQATSRELTQRAFPLRTGSMSPTPSWAALRSDWTGSRRPARSPSRRTSSGSCWAPIGRCAATTAAVRSSGERTSPT